MVTVAGWSLKGSGRQMKNLQMRSDGDEVLYSLNQKHTLPVARCWSDWTVSVEREAAEWGGDAARDGERWSAGASCPPLLRIKLGDLEGASSNCAPLSARRRYSQSVCLTGCWNTVGTLSNRPNILSNMRMKSPPNLCIRRGERRKDGSID